MALMSAPRALWRSQGSGASGPPSPHSISAGAGTKASCDGFGAGAAQPTVPPAFARVSASEAPPGSDAGENRPVGCSSVADRRIDGRSGARGRGRQRDRDGRAAVARAGLFRVSRRSIFRYIPWLPGSSRYSCDGREARAPVQRDARDWREGRRPARPFRRASDTGVRTGPVRWRTRRCWPEVGQPSHAAGDWSARGNLLDRSVPRVRGRRGRRGAGTGRIPVHSL